ncbi:MAG: hypothetical protein U9Q82_07215 [Chloroflexota bacterium]|nr:hypothetical protein [Chloroflexota bacterium]
MSKNPLTWMMMTLIRLSIVIVVGWGVFQRIQQQVAISKSLLRSVIR